MNEKFTKESVKEALEVKLSRYFGVNPEDANKEQIIFRSCATYSASDF